MALIVRKSHIVRLYGFNGGDDFDDSTWMELQRIDAWSDTTGKGQGYQGTIRIFDWSTIEKMEIDNGPGGRDDDGNLKLGWADDGPVDLGDLIFTRRKIKNPDNEDQYVIVPLLLLIRDQNGRGQTFEGTRKTFDNSDSNEFRKVRIDRISHVDDVNNPDANFDDSQTLDVEVPLMWARNSDTGAGFQGYDQAPQGNGALPGRRQTIDTRI